MSKFSKKTSEPSSKGVSYKSNSDKVDWEIDKDVSIVVDMDEQVFKVAAACEEKLLKYTNKESQGEGFFKNKTQFKKLMEGLDVDPKSLPDFFDVEEVIKTEKISHAITTLKRRLSNICKICKCHPDNMDLYIDGEGNFRDEIPLAVKYKGNRDGKSKPELFKELKQYCIDYLYAEEVDGMECDDVICIRVAEGKKQGEKVIGVSSDKDSLQTQGWWFNYEKWSEPRIVKGFGSLYIDTSLSKPTVKGEGWKFLYYQCLHQDQADNYSSRDVYKRILTEGDIETNRKAPAWGDKSTYKVLEDCNTHRECLKVLISKYKAWYTEEEFEYLDWKGETHKATWLDVLDMQFQLAYMKRSWNDKVTLRGVLKKVGLL